MSACMYVVRVLYFLVIIIIKYRRETKNTQNKYIQKQHKHVEGECVTGMDDTVSCLLLILYAQIFYHTYFERFQRFHSSVMNGFDERRDC